MSDALRRTEIVQKWLKDYDSLTFAQHQAVYSALWETNLPPQAYFDAVACDRLNWDGAQVCEIGGWDGQLAERILSARGNIDLWCNFEVCREASLESLRRIQDERYMTGTLHWAWESPLLPWMNTLVASHSLEHMKQRHLVELLNVTKHFRQAFIQVPWDMSPGVQSTHILDLSVEQLVDEFVRFGWRETWNRRGPDDICVTFIR